MAAWISMSEVCRLLGVRSQTVYAYVSRGKIEVMPDPVDTRRSLYRAEDVANLAACHAGGHLVDILDLEKIALLDVWPVDAAGEHAQDREQPGGTRERVS